MPASAVPYGGGQQQPRRSHSAHNTNGHANFDDVFDINFNEIFDSAALMGQPNSNYRGISLPKKKKG